MEGLIPFVIDVIKRSHERGTYHSISSSDGSGLHLIDYSELPEAADDGPAAASLRRTEDEEYARPAAVAIGSAYRR
jgi:hypothetical protein